MLRLALVDSSTMKECDKEHSRGQEADHERKDTKKERSQNVKEVGGKLF
jgi:hypothetical protein